MGKPNVGGHDLNAILWNRNIACRLGSESRAPSYLIEPRSQAEVVAGLDRSGTIARGLGRSYGDCTINAGKQVVGTARLNRLLAFDEDTGMLTCEGGASLENISRPSPDAAGSP